MLSPLRIGGLKESIRRIATRRSCWRVAPPPDRPAQLRHQAQSCGVHAIAGVSGAPVNRWNPMSMTWRRGRVREHHNACARAQVEPHETAIPGRSAVFPDNLPRLLHRDRPAERDFGARIPRPARLELCGHRGLERRFRIAQFGGAERQQIVGRRPERPRTRKRRHIPVGRRLTRMIMTLGLAGPPGLAQAGRAGHSRKRARDALAHQGLELDASAQRQRMAEGTPKPRFEYWKCSPTSRARV